MSRDTYWVVPGDMNTSQDGVIASLMNWWGRATKRGPKRRASTPDIDYSEITAANLARQELIDWDLKFQEALLYRGRTSAVQLPHQPPQPR